MSEPTEKSDGTPSVPSGTGSGVVRMAGEVDRELPPEATRPGHLHAGEEPVTGQKALEVTVPGDLGSEATIYDHAQDATLASDQVPEVVTDESDPLVGQTLHHFKIIRRLGSGGMGTVYLAHDLSLDRPVALKVMSGHVSRDPTQRDRFVREARSQARMSHPNVVGIFYVGDQDGQLFFAMEYVSDEALSARLDRGERLDWAEALEVVIGVAEALRAAHRSGIVHRDIKPSNVLRDPQGLVKVADFGLAKAVAAQPVADLKLTQQGQVLGSPIYMSPEQGQGEAVDHRSDIYSLGATFFHLLVGRPPFMAKTSVGLLAKHLSETPPSLREERAEVPLALEEILARMLAKRPEDRYQDYDELLAALKAAQPRVEAPAGFFPRAIAFGVDYTIASFLLAVSSILGLLFFGAYLSIGWWRTGKSVGKWLLRLRVRRVDGRPLTLGRCVLRVFLLNWGFLAVMAIAVGVFGATSVGPENPVVRQYPGIATVAGAVIALVLLVYVTGLAWAGIRRHKRAWHDLALGTHVVYDLPKSRSAD